MAEHSHPDQNMPPPPARLTEEPLPPYAFVPGMHLRPQTENECRGGIQSYTESDRSDAAAFRRLHCRAVDLFNYGYYWESHEFWESLWNCLGRVGAEAKFAKGLIKLAAAGVKAREGRPNGVRRHALRASILFSDYARMAPAAGQDYFGLSADWLDRECIGIVQRADVLCDTTCCSVQRVLPVVLIPEFKSLSQGDIVAWRARPDQDSD